MGQSVQSIDIRAGEIEPLLRRLETSDRGLTSAEASARLARYGPNQIARRRRLTVVRGLLARFGNPLVLILLGAAAVSAFTGDVASFAIIAVVVVLSVSLDFLQEYRAERAAEALQEQVALRVRVMRDGREAELPARSLVPGDVVRLSAGDLVPADGRLLAADDFFVNEALLTGEPYPVEKQVDPPSSDSKNPREAANVVFMGSSVVSGSARALVAATGTATQLGQISSELHREPPPTAFQLGIRDFGMLIVRVTALLILFVLLVNLLAARPLLQSFLFALALAVGLTPELLPMIVTVTLGHGAMRMARQKVIVKRLSAIHDLGGIDVLCCDKTGTLTEARIRLIRKIDLEGNDSPEVLKLAHLNSRFETGIRSPLDEAILEHGGADSQGWTKLDEVPFDFERRRVSVLLAGEGKRLLIVKGAPEDVLRICTSYRTANAATVNALDDDARARAQRLFEALGDQGFRALGIAFGEVGADHDHARVDDESGLTFAGFAAFLDPPKESARAAIDGLARLGVDVKIVTGDNERVTRFVCLQLGLPVRALLTGSEMSGLTDEALSARLRETTLFCRMTPAQKARIIRALRRRGHVVGYLGDGINDAPSLHSADVGISVDSAVDVAKEAAAMILLEQDLGVLERGIREGRRTFSNIIKYVMMGTSSNFGNMLSMAGASLFLPFLPMLPVQILLNNLLYDFSEAAVPLDRVDPDMIERPRRWDVKFIRDSMLTFGSVSSVFDFLTFGVLLWVFGASAPLFQTGWFIESIATQVLVIFLIRTRGKAHRSRPHSLLIATSLAVVFAAAAIPFTPVGAWFGFVEPPVRLLVTIAILTAAYLAAVEIVKQWFFRRHPLAARRPPAERGPA
ncbi:MAG TPA: magnesium-translocating P-type ATPase [Methylomirabilota bacterium]|nr:magnesium-translocating P-type ATPase [Methylomirabilota bacterium]